MLLKTGLAAALLCLLALTTTPSARAAMPMTTGEPTVAPRGFIGFCAKYLAECCWPPR
jgi:predicted transglutaminase-like cysteine proteinase